MFRILKDGKTVVEGDSPLTIPNLTPNTEYKAGTYKYEYEEDGRVSDQHDVQTFKTKPVTVTGVSLDKTTISGKPGDKGKLIPTIKPSNATNKGFTFSSSAASIIKVDNAGNWEMLKDGTADLTVKTTDGGKTAVCKGTCATPEPDSEG